MYFFPCVRGQTLTSVGMGTRAEMVVVGTPREATVAPAIQDTRQVVMVKNV